ncbi:MAG: sulfotransferase domain-containing protein [Bacteroidota bacterium]
MLNYVKSKWRTAHVSENHLKLNSYLRLNKKTFEIYNINDAVPNLIIVGSQKCGTSSLHYYLDEHPNIYMSAPIKEAGYFIFDEWGKDYWEKRGDKIDTKLDLKRNYTITDRYINQKYDGDSSTHYTIGNRVQDYDIPLVIKKESPKAKIIYLIRNPFARVTSAYYHFVKYHKFTDSIDDFILKYKSVISTTLFFDQIKPFAELFSGNLLLLNFEDLIKNTKIVMNKTYKFLELEPHNHEEFRVYNKTSPNKSSKFSRDSYDNLSTIFTRQKVLMEGYFNIELNWDLTEKTWVI